MDIIDLKLQNGKPVGFVEDHIAVLPVTSRNFLALAKGYTIDGFVLDRVKAMGCAAVEFRTRTKGKRLRIGLERFLTLAKVYNFGFGPKWACHHCYYEEVTPEGFPPPDVGEAGRGYVFA